MPARVAYLVRPDMDTGAYIRMGPPGPIVELPTVSHLLKIYMKVFNYFTNYLETWSQVRATGFCGFCGCYCFYRVMD